MALENLKREDFEAAKGSVFRLAAPQSEPRDLILAEVETLSREAAPPEAGRSPFSLIFREEGASTYFHQTTVHLEHPDLGAFDLFLVPIGPDEEGMRYQAIFT